MNKHITIPKDSFRWILSNWKQRLSSPSVTTFWENKVANSCSTFQAWKQLGNNQNIEDQ